MKLLDTIRNKPILCPRCGGENFTDFDMATQTSTFHIHCKKKGCTQIDPQGKIHQTDFLIPVHAVKKHKSIVVVKKHK